MLHASASSWSDSEPRPIHAQRAELDADAVAGICVVLELERLPVEAPRERFQRVQVGEHVEVAAFDDQLDRMNVRAARRCVAARPAATSVRDRRVVQADELQAALPRSARRGSRRIIRCGGIRPGGCGRPAARRSSAICCLQRSARSRHRDAAADPCDRRRRRLASAMPFCRSRQLRRQARSLRVQRLHQHARPRAEHDARARRARPARVRAAYSASKRARRPATAAGSFMTALLVRRQRPASAALPRGSAAGAPALLLVAGLLDHELVEARAVQRRVRSRGSAGSAARGPHRAWRR